MRPDHHLLLFFIFFFSGKIWAQITVPAAYSAWVKSADSLFNAKKFQLAAQHYHEAFKSFEGKGFVSDRYQAAGAWAMVGLADSAFVQLEKIVWKGKFDDYSRMLADSTLFSLHIDRRWVLLAAQVRKQHGIVDSLWNQQLYDLIDSMAREDQKWRNRHTHLENHSPNDSVQIRLAGKMFIKVDSANYFVLRSIVAAFGFPTRERIGKAGANKFWLLIQHQDQHLDFQKEVLHLMEQEWVKGKVSSTDYAYLVDRVKVNSGELQVYGTQFDLSADRSTFIPKPVIDPTNLNARRAKMGMDSIESYMQTANRRYFGSLQKKED